MDLMQDDDDSLLFLNSSEEKLILSDVDRDLFLEALVNPPSPNEKLIEAFKAYDKLQSQSDR